MESKLIATIDEVGGALVISANSKSQTYLGPKDDARFVKDLLKTLGLATKFEVKERV